MPFDPLVLRVAARFQRLTNQPAGARQDAVLEVKPINRPKGISHETIRDYAHTDDKGNKTDIQPKDVFQPKPKHMNVLDYVNKGWPGTSGTYSDMQHALQHEIPNDKGHATVNNLSQYLVRTEGGGGTPAVKKKE